MQAHHAKTDLLVIEAQQGDKRAFEALFNLYNKPLLRFAYRLCNDQMLAADAVQEAWLTLSKTLPRLDDPRGFRAWAYKTVRWRVTDGARSRKLKLVSLDDAADVAVPEDEPDATPGQLSAHLERLSGADRQLLALFYLDELKLTEVAGVLDVPVGTVKSRLNRAKARLRQQIEGDK